MAILDPVKVDVVQIGKAEAFWSRFKFSAERGKPAGFNTK
jgi:hypothetical protein